MNSNNDLSNQPDPIQQKMPGSFKQIKLFTLVTTIFFIAIIAGTGGYFLGMRSSRSIQLPTPTSHTTTALLSATPTIIPTLFPSIPSGWITYHSVGGRYSISAPFDWTTNQYSGNVNSAIVDSIDLIPPNQPALPSESLTIKAGNPSEVSTLISPHIGYDDDPSWFLENKMYTMPIASYTATVWQYVWKPTAPPDFAGEWSNNTEKFISIPIDANRQIAVYLKWHNTSPQFGPLFDKILSTIRVDK
jgi:hypothetical protein